MNPHLRRFIITVAVLGLAFGVLLVTILSQKRQAAAPTTDQPATETETPAQSPAQSPAGTPARTPGATPAPSATPPPVPGLHAVWEALPDTPPAPLGSLDPREAGMYLEFSPAGAGLERITLSEYWLTAAQSRQAHAHYDAIAGRDPNPPPLPDPSGRYVLQSAQQVPAFNAATAQWTTVSVPQLGAYAVVVNGVEVSLVKKYTDDGGTSWVLWRETAPGAFEATLEDEDDRPVARITRRFELGSEYDIAIRQEITNLTSSPLEVKWIQYGPGDLIVDRARYMDRRRFRFGYLPDAALFPDLIASDDGDMLFERQKVLKHLKKAAKTTDPQRLRELTTLWPDPAGVNAGYELSWFAATNRYFALAVHPLLDVSATGSVSGSRSLAVEVSEIRPGLIGDVAATQVIFTHLYSPPRTIEAGGATSFDLGVYAGPLRRDVLAFQQPLAALQMSGLILYQMSAMCAICTFQWLAIGLLKFLSIVDVVTGDWGVSIILLVLLVRTLLHPLTKRAQISLQRFGKVMSDLKPEIEKLQKKYPDDSRKLQQEQMKLMRERGANPLQMLGCLPMLLQTPIWIALYAMLYFAFELRHEPAFWGFFQLFWGWEFLGDLSAADHCFWVFQKPFKFLMWNMTGINLLPLLLGVVFYIQQKYMSPPPSAAMTPEQAQQQKIMKIMMVVMFPVMLYSAPSGLCLYICTSSFVGIIESKYVRAHIKAMDLEPPKPTQKKKTKDIHSRAYASAMERAKQKRKPPPKTYKKRK